MILSHADRLPPRRGAILLVVMTLTALFAVVALSFALYSESAANSSRINREAAATNDGPPASDAFASLFLGRLIYPTDPLGANYGTINDTTVGSVALLNALRGYDMATMVYGFHPTAANNTPYNGIGTVFEDLTTNPTASAVGITDRRQVVNYSWQNGFGVFDPEFLGARPNATAGPTTAYVGRNAPYTYPDRNNLYLAVQDPTTGKILKVSFVSPHFGSLKQPTGAPTDNPNWTNAAGRFMTIRPRPADHVFNGTQDFPFPPLNPDGTVTGDVQNIPNIEGLQQNDAVWVNAGLPVIQWRGKNIIPLIAPTILALDGRVNANVAGNVKNTSNTPSLHGSTHGFGPWEINLSRILAGSPTGPADAASLVNDRAVGTSLNPRGSSTNSLPFSSTITQAWAAVNWDANSASQIQMPTGNQSDPTYGPGYDYANSATALPVEAQGHPGLLNPYSWNSFTKSAGSTNTAKLFSFGDLRRSSIKYSGRSAEYASPYFMQSAPNSLQGTVPSNPSNVSRALLTTVSNSLVRPGLQPNFPEYTTSVFTLGDPSNLATTAGRPVASPLSLTNPMPAPAPAAVVSSDFPSPTTIRSATAALGAVDLNRPLADYRAPASASPTGPLSPTNLTNLQPAVNDRQALARDIFVRLILATGAKANLNMTTGVLQLPQPAATATTPPTYTLVTASDTTQQQYDALRHLAQIAANIVDYIDNDDINTTFVWNPTTAGNVTLADNGQTELQTLFSNPATAQPLRTAYLQDRVVFGVEKPRVVLNEVYAEIANSPNDSSSMAANNDFHVRFFIELCNPTNTGGDATAVLGNGTAALTYMGSSAYKVQVFKTGNEVRSALFDPTQSYNNVTGRADGLSSQRIDALLPTTAQYSIEPNNGQANTTGFRLLAPDLTGVSASSAQELISDSTKPPFSAPPYSTNTIYVPNGSAPPAAGGMTMSTTLAYQEAKKQPSSLKQNGYFNQFADHAVVLRRLTNPYLTANDPFDSSFNAALPINPFVTVDVSTDIAVQDAIRVGQQEGLDGTRPKGGDAMKMANARSSKGRMAPHYAFRTPVNGPFAGGFTQTQNGAMGGGGPAGQQTTLLYHNNPFISTATPTASVQWLPHLDRPLINQIELLHVASCKPHELTYRFSATNDTSGATPLPQLQTVDWYPKNATNVPPTATWAVTTTSTTLPPSMYRGLELLTVKPWGYGLPLGGRTPGKININMIWSQTVLEALLDQSSTAIPNTANSFTGMDVSTLYNSFLFSNTQPGARTKAVNGTPGDTTDEVAPPTAPAPDTRDRPFKPFGTASFIPATTPPAPPATVLLPIGSGLQDTLLRDTNPAATTGTPALFPNSNPAVTHPYQKAEMLRKMYNNITTTSDTFLVVMTVGYFEVRNAGPYTTSNPPVLGKEVFIDVPTDMRSKYVAVVDRSMLAQAIDQTTGNILNQQSDRLFFTDVADAGTPQSIPANPGATPLTNPPVTLTIHCNFDTNGSTPVLFYEGRRFTFGGSGPDAITAVALGTGPQAVIITGVNVSAAPGAVNQAAGTVTLTGTAQLTLPANAPARPILPGTAVSSGLLANPGPQTNFDVNAPQFKGVVPFFDRITLGQ